MTPKLRLPAALLLVAVIVVVSLVVADDGSEDGLSAVAEHMHGHLDSVVAMKAAVIEGNLEAVYEPARWLAEHEAPPQLPKAWARYEDEMRNQARGAANAADLETAATAVSGIGKACGDCHLAAGFAVSFGYAKPPPQDLENNVTMMQRHLWAADRMWAALIGPSDAAWDSGTEMLSTVKLSATQLTKDPRKQPRVDELIQQARDVGERGTELTAIGARTTLYGEFLSLCANCHSLTGGGPRL